ncbi:MAG: hypothetical protein ABFC95_02880, partial [Smithella sp.]
RMPPFVRFAYIQRALVVLNGCRGAVKHYFRLWTPNGQICRFIFKNRWLRHLFTEGGGGQNDSKKTLTKTAPPINSNEPTFVV